MPDCQHVLECPRIGAPGGHRRPGPDHADGHSGRRSVGGHAGKLFVELPLQPGMKVHPVGQLGASRREPSGVAGLRNSSGQANQCGPCASTNAHQVAKSTGRRPHGHDRRRSAPDGQRYAERRGATPAPLAWPPTQRVPIDEVVGAATPAESRGELRDAGPDRLGAAASSDTDSTDR